MEGESMNEAVTLRLQGLIVRDICEQTGLSKWQVDKELRAAGLAGKNKTHKRCRVCGATKAISEFPLKSQKRGTGTYISYNCNDCAPRMARNRTYKYKYGITLEEYENLFISQDGRCAICKEEQPDMNLAVDHNHETDEIRGLLCDRCNRGIGFMRDNPDLLIKAASYLMVDELEKVGVLHG